MAISPSMIIRVRSIDNTDGVGNPGQDICRGALSPRWLSGTQRAKTNNLLEELQTRLYCLYIISLFLNCVRVAKFKRPRVHGDQKIREDNQELRPGCPPDYQNFCERIYPKYFIPTNLSSYPSLTNKNSSMRISTTYIQ